MTLICVLVMLICVVVTHICVVVTHIHRMRTGDTYMRTGDAHMRTGDAYMAICVCMPSSVFIWRPEFLRNISKTSKYFEEQYFKLKPKQCLDHISPRSRRY